MKSLKKYHDVARELYIKCQWVRTVYSYRGVHKRKWPKLLSPANMAKVSEFDRFNFINNNPPSTLEACARIFWRILQYKKQHINPNKNLYLSVSVSPWRSGWFVELTTFFCAIWRRTRTFRGGSHFVFASIVMHDGYEKLPRKKFLDSSIVNWGKNKNQEPKQ